MEQQDTRSPGERINGKRLLGAALVAVTLLVLTLLAHAGVGEGVHAPRGAQAPTASVAPTTRATATATSTPSVPPPPPHPHPPVPHPGGGGGSGQGPQRGHWYQVQWGDTLWLLATKVHYPGGWPALYRANAIRIITLARSHQVTQRFYDHIYVGQWLLL